MNQTIEIPADARTVTLELKKHNTFTLRALLPQIKSEVELVIIDEFGRGVSTDADLYRLKANSGDELLLKLARSRIVDGESVLDLMPNVRFQEPHASLLNGSVVTLTGTGFVQLLVKPLVPED